MGSREGTVGKLMSSCPHINLSIGGVMVPCLVDTGSIVSTVTESFFLKHFAPWGADRLQSCHWLQLWAANGLAIPYIGYLELDVALCGKVFRGCGILVVQDPPGGSSSVSGILRMNVIRRSYRDLFGAHGAALFSLPVVTQAPGSVIEALQQCHQSTTRHPKDLFGTVRVRGPRAVRIPGCVMQFVVSTCPEQFYGQDVLFKPPQSGLPAGLLASPCLVQAVRGTVYIPVVNVGTTEVLLHPRTSLGALSCAQVVSLPTGVTEVRSATATVSSQVAGSPAQSGVEAVDLSALAEQDQAEVRSLLQKYSSVFSAYDGDLRCTDLISHDIPLLDNPVIG